MNCCFKHSKKRNQSNRVSQLGFQGFGNPAGEHWLGNELVSQLTNLKGYVLRIHLQDWEGSEAYSLYEHFSLASEELKYR